MGQCCKGCSVDCACDDEQDWDRRFRCVWTCPIDSAIPFVGIVPYPIGRPSSHPGVMPSSENRICEVSMSGELLGAPMLVLPDQEVWSVPCGEEGCQIMHRFGLRRGLLYVGGRYIDRWRNACVVAWYDTVYPHRGSQPVFRMVWSTRGWVIDPTYVTQLVGVRLMF
jgi:hypothetical protein